MRARALLTALAMLTIAACAGPPATSADTASKPAWTLSAGTPAPTGDLTGFTWAMYAEPPTLDWISAHDYPENDPLTWIYNLRNGVRFSNGDPLTASDAVFSLDRTWTSPNSNWAQTFQNVKSITATGPLQVTVRLTSETNALLTGEADGAYLVPPDSYAKLAASQAGTLYFGQSLTTVTINIDNLKGPVGNVKVRQALSLALDGAGRTAVARTGYREGAGADHDRAVAPVHAKDGRGEPAVLGRRAGRLAASRPAWCGRWRRRPRSGPGGRA